MLEILQEYGVLLLIGEYPHGKLGGLAMTLIIAIVIYQTAYLGEIIAAGIEGLPKGQMEAAKALGLGYIPTTFKVVLPQALFNVVPGIVNQLTTIIKESSLGSIIAVPELSYAMLQVNSNEVTKPLQIFGILAATYFVLCFALSQATGVLERRVANRRTGRVIVEAVA